MSTDLDSPPSKTRNALDALAEKQKPTSYVLFVIGVALAALPVWLGIEYGMPWWPVIASTALLALIPLIGGVWNLLREPGETPQPELMRMLLLVLGGLLGLTLTLVAITLALQPNWWKVVVGGMTEWQGPDKWRLWVMEGVFLGGIALMFASLLLGRAEERSSASVRRLVYGNNAVVSALVLLLILVRINVFAGNYLKGTDWSTRSLYSLSSSSISVLQGISKPTKVYVIMSPRQEQMLRMVRGLLENCQAVNSQLQVEYLSPDQDRSQVKELADKYKDALREREGLLVVSGVEPRQQTHFITLADLAGESMDARMRGRDSRAFKGESELINAINSLEEGKQKSVIYFTQGNEELDISERGGRQPDRQAGALRRELERANYTVKGLVLSDVAGVKPKDDIVVASKVPDDAAVVVIAGARTRFSEEALTALRDYMEKERVVDKGKDSEKEKKKGALVVLMYSPRDATGKPPESTGVEEFLASYGVEAKNDRLLSVSRGGLARTVGALPNPDARNPVATQFDKDDAQFELLGARTVEPSPGKGPFQSDSLLLAPSGRGQFIIVDTTFDDQRVIELAKTGKLTIHQGNIPVAVAVSDSGPPPSPHAFTPPPTSSKPRMVVFGSSYMISDLAQGGQWGPCYDLFRSCLGWLRDKPAASIGIQPKQPDTYQMKPGVDWTRMIWLPLALMSAAIIGLGAGVWVVRRK